ncbi:MULTISPECIES: hypothetical protein [unclassified Sphingomonas]|uniref:hypothetical protein n=1 Tax=unclassified Sphingomonas TaxID=196159 RepID=UPI000F73A6BF|nr:hypothetical protein [Sphingomonas sp. FARSPH]
MARAIASLLLGIISLPLGSGGIFNAVRGHASPPETFVSIVFFVVGVASLRGVIRSLKHYRHPSSLIMDEDGIEVADIYQTRRWAWTDILGATTGRGTIFITLIVRRSARSHSYVDIGPWPRGTLRDILAEKAAR